MRYRLAWLAALALPLAAAPADAHHSFAMFDLAKSVTITGSVRQFQWTNPHSYIQLLVKDAKGKDVEWSLEMGAPMYLYANGWRPKTLKAGDKITVKLNPLRNGSPGGIVISATTPDGRTLGNQVKNP